MKTCTLILLLAMAQAVQAAHDAPSADQNAQFGTGFKKDFNACRDAVRDRNGYSHRAGWLKVLRDIQFHNEILRCMNGL